MSSTYNAVFTFSGPVTSGQATVTSGTGTAGTPTFSGSTMTVPLTGVADQQVITIQVSNINGDGTVDGNVPFGFLIADVDANRVVNKTDATPIKSNKNQPANSSNFRDDINLSGLIDKTDFNLVKSNNGHSLP